MKKYLFAFACVLIFGSAWADDNRLTTPDPNMPSAEQDDSTSGNTKALICSTCYKYNTNCERHCTKDPKRTVLDALKESAEPKAVQTEGQSREKSK